MEWSISKKVNKNIGQAADEKFIQVRIDRNLANSFKMMCVALDTSQKQIIEDYIQDRVSRFNKGSWS
tara:strand:- start:421 stop:621 length:201 start_codon:yes stop_codon:yes gene_type:complete